MSHKVSTVEFMHMMDVMVDCVGRTRVGYLLSVPVGWGLGIHWLLTPWIRLERAWTPKLATSVVFAEKMLSCGACCMMMYRKSNDHEQGWQLGSPRHPGRAAAHPSLISPLDYSATTTHNSGCKAVLRQGIAQRVRQGRRWDTRVARQSWAVLFMQGVPE